MSQSGILNTGVSPPAVATQYVTDAGTAIPAANILNVLGAGGTTTSGAGNTVTITSAGGGGLAWNVITASQTLAVNNGYFCAAPGGALALALPAVSAVGDTIAVSLVGATSWTITQGVGQEMSYGNLVTTNGVGGSVTSTEQGDTIMFVCNVANVDWTIISSVGNPTLV